jgi:hypothetical protein
MDLESRRRWEDYGQAREEILGRTHIPEARWWIVDGADKRKARLNCIHHLLQQIPYRGRLAPEHKPNYLPGPIADPNEMHVPAVY